MKTMTRDAVVYAIVTAAKVIYTCTRSRTKAITEAMIVIIIIILINSNIIISPTSNLGNSLNRRPLRWTPYR